MIGKLIHGLLNFIMHLVGLLFSPIDLAIQALLPNLSNALGLISDWVNTFKSYIPFVISYTGLTTTTLTIIISLLTACVMVPLGVHAFKLAIKWYNALKV